MITLKNCSEPEIIGIVIVRRRRHHDAPSIAAASYNAVSTVVMADKMTTIPNPNEVHTRAKMTTALAVQGYSSHENCPSPKTLSNLSTAPPGKKIVLNSTPTMTGDSTTGMKNKNRKTLHPRTFS